MHETFQVTQIKVVDAKGRPTGLDSLPLSSTASSTSQMATLDAVGRYGLETRGDVGQSLFPPARDGSSTSGSPRSTGSGNRYVSEQDGLECAFEIQKILTRNSNRGRFNSPQSVSMPTLPARQISSSQFLTAPTPVTASSGSTSPLVRPIPRQGSFDMFSLPTTFIASGPARSPSSSEEELSDDETPSRLVADLLLPERPELHFPAPMNRPNLGQSVRPRLGRSMTVFPPHEDESDAALSVTPPERTNNPLPRNSPFWDRARTGVRLGLFSTSPPPLRDDPERNSRRERFLRMIGSSSSDESSSFHPLA